MSWQQSGHLMHRTLLDPPDDGIALSRSTTGWLGKRLRRLIDGMAKGASDRVRRGRNYALRGRARDLVIHAGTASVDVWCDEVYRPSVHLAPLSSADWRVVVDELAGDLSSLAQLLEGDLPEALVVRLEEAGVRLVPTRESLSGDCDCGDWASPCTHVATLLHLLAEALDGDPFLLLSLRGRSSQDLLAALRERWGDAAPMESAHVASEEPVPEGDPFVSPGGLPVLRAAGLSDGGDALGLRALGPAPGGVDLITTLSPLYEAGREAARQVLERVPDREPPRRRPRPVVVEPPPAPAPVAPAQASEPSSPAPASASPSPAPAVDPVPVGSLDALAARVAGLLASEPRSSAAVARELGCPVTTVRQALARLVDAGMVGPVRTEQGARWWSLR